MALPGVSTTIKDQFTSLSKTSAPSGPLICVLATRDTPSGTNSVLDLNPYSITSEAQAIAAYGNASQCHRAYLELAAAGATNIAIVALPAGTTDNDIRQISLLNNTLTDQAFQAAAACLPDIVVPWGRGGCPEDWTAPGATPSATEYAATPSDMAASTGALTGFTTQFGYSAGLLCSDGTTPMAARVAQLVSGITAGSNPCFAVLGVRPYVGTGVNAQETVVASELANYLNFNNSQNVTNYTAINTLANASIMGDFGPYVQVVAGEYVPVTYPYNPTLQTFDWGYSNGACAYAATAASIQPWIATTGKLLSNAVKIRYNPTIAQLTAVDNMNIVPLAINYSGRPYWVDGVTFSLAGSDFSRLSTLRTVFSAVQAIRQLALQFVGQPASLQIQNAFQTAVSSTLRGMITLGALNAADYNVSFSPLTNSAEIDLVLTPSFEIRSVSLVVSVNF